MSTSYNRERHMYKIVVFGDGGVGKTTFINRYLNGTFTLGTKMTIGVNISNKKFKFQQKQIELQIWDFAGEDRFRFILPGYVRGAKGGLFLFDITRFQSLKNMEQWIDLFRGHCQPGMGGKSTPILMVGTKSDLSYRRSIDAEYARSLAKKYNLIGYEESSSKTGENIENIFKKITESMMIQTGVYEPELKNRISLKYEG